jgi:hypothetical protein
VLHRLLCVSATQCDTISIEPGRRTGESREEPESELDDDLLDDALEREHGIRCVCVFVDQVCYGKGQ